MIQAEREKDNYYQSEKLDELYASHNVSEDPGERERFLEKHLGISNFDKSSILRVSGKREDEAWLKILERGLIFAKE